MKKVFFALAVVAMFSFAACNGNTEATDSVPDTTAVTEDQPAETPADVTCDSAVADSTVAPENNAQ